PRAQGQGADRRGGGPDPPRGGGALLHHHDRAGQRRGRDRVREAVQASGPRARRPRRRVVPSAHGRRPPEPRAVAARGTGGPARGAVDPRAERCAEAPRGRGAEGLPLAGRVDPRQAHRGHRPQMMRRVAINESNSTEFLPGAIVERAELTSENKRVLTEGGSPASARPVLMGITKASLATDSWLSAASFQETTRVLTDAAINKRSDQLVGLKEN